MTTINSVFYISCILSIVIAYTSTIKTLNVYVYVHVYVYAGVWKL